MTRNLIAAVSVIAWTCCGQLQTVVQSFNITFEISAIRHIINRSTSDNATENCFLGIEEILRNDSQSTSIANTFELNLHPSVLNASKCTNIQETIDSCYELATNLYYNEYMPTNTAINCKFIFTDDIFNIHPNNTVTLTSQYNSSIVESFIFVSRPLTGTSIDDDIINGTFIALPIASAIGVDQEVTIVSLSDYDGKIIFENLYFTEYMLLDGWEEDFGNYSYENDEMGSVQIFNVSSSKLEIIDSKFFNVDIAGIIYCNFCIVEISNTDFINISSTIGTSDRSSFHLLNNSSILLTNVMFQDIYSSIDSSQHQLINVGKNSDLICTNCDVLSSLFEIQWWGSTIWDYTSMISCTDDNGLIIFDSSYIDSNYGSLISFDSPDWCTVSLIDSTFTNNRARSIIAGDASSGGGYVDLINCVFESNSGTNEGSVVSSQNGFFLDLYINNSYFKSNWIREGMGGVLYVVEGAIKIDNCMFIDSYNGWTGGVIFGGRHGKYALVSIYNSTFKDNFASSGGVITLFKGKVVVNNSYFEGNGVWKSGGVFYMGWEETSDFVISLLIDNSTFNGNYCWWFGAVVFTGTIFDEFVISNNLFVNNYADYGGGFISVYLTSYIYDVEERNFESMVIMKFEVMDNHFLNNSCFYYGSVYSIEINLDGSRAKSFLYTVLKLSICSCTVINNTRIFFFSSFLFSFLFSLPPALVACFFCLLAHVLVFFLSLRLCSN